MKPPPSFFLILLLTSVCIAQEESTDELRRKADNVYIESSVDFINAAKSSAVVFAAAHAFEKEGQASKALEYYEKGLRLSPWSLEEQLACAKLKNSIGLAKEAMATAKMVLSRTESDVLANTAAQMLGSPAFPKLSYWDGKKPEGRWLCFVRFGPVNEVMLRDTIQRIQETLGLSALIAPETLALPRAGRSGLHRFVHKNLIPSIRWTHPAMQQILDSLGTQNPEAVPPEALMKAMIKAFRANRMMQEADDLQESLNFNLKCQMQYDSGLMLNLVQRWTAQQPELSNAIVIGITEADIYAENVNYLFGAATTGGSTCFTSAFRFRADLAGEPPDRKRLVARVHRQLLSSIGFCLNVPRPSDPTSARAYPASVQEQDAKSEFMSETCIAAFEKALGQKLPAAAHAPEFRQ